jgi:hypothetical protein
MDESLRLAILEYLTAPPLLQGRMVAADPALCHPDLRSRWDELDYLWRDEGQGDA